MRWSLGVLWWRNELTAGESQAAATKEMDEQRVIALLGRKDEPTDAVEEYWHYLGGALRAHGFNAEIARVAWNEHGWASALDELRREANKWHGQWVCAQYTALQWSRRGFPLRFLQVLDILRRSGARIAV